MNDAQSEAMFGMLGRLAVPAIIIMGAIILTSVLTQKSPDKKLVWWPLAAAGVLVALSLVNILLGMNVSGGVR